MKKTVWSAVLVVVAMLVGAGNALAGPPMEGGGCFDFGASLVPAVGPTGEEGRSVFFTDPAGTIKGENFEPGICNPLPDDPTPDLPIWFGGKCLFFTRTASDAPGTFQRLHPGQTAFTYCRDCEIDGRTGNFTLKISYPNPKSFGGDPEATPFTKFTIQDGTGELAGLRGQGTLDFLTGCYTMNYQFVR